MEYEEKILIELGRLSSEILTQSNAGDPEYLLSCAAEGLGKIAIKQQQLLSEMAKDRPETDLLLKEIAALYLRIILETHF